MALIRWICPARREAGMPLYLNRILMRDAVAVTDSQTVASAESSQIATNPSALPRKVLLGAIAHGFGRSLA